MFIDNDVNVIFLYLHNPSYTFESSMFLPDERDHSTCCTRYNVPDSCMPLCRGGSSEAPDLMAIACLTYAEEILTCMSVGYGKWGQNCMFLLMMHHQNLFFNLLILPIPEIFINLAYIFIQYVCICVCIYVCMLYL